MNTDVVEIDNTIEKIIQRSRKLVDILEREKILLTESDYEKLEQHTGVKKEHVDNLELECDLLKSLFDKLSLTFSLDGLKKLCKIAPESLKTELERKTNLMLDLLKRAESLNQVNGILLVSRHNYNQQLLSFVTRTQVKPDTYGPNVGKQSSVSTRGHKA